MREFVIALQSRGVLLEVVDGKLRCRGSLSSDERKILSANAPLIAAIIEPDETLPDEIVIPATTPNNIVVLADYINRQRKQVAA